MRRLDNLIWTKKNKTYSLCRLGVILLKEKHRFICIKYKKTKIKSLTNLKTKTMKKIMLIAGLLTMMSCKEKEVKHRNDYEYCCSYSILEIPGRKPKLLYVEQENGLISFLLEKNGKVIKYEEAYSFHPLDSNEVKLLIKWVKDDTAHPVISNFKNALLERLELDRTEGEMTINDVKNN